MSQTAYIALGSNLGDRHAYLDQAIRALRAQPGIGVGRVSSYQETEPVGGPGGQGKYLNAAAELHTGLGPAALLQTLLRVEESLGRVRGERFGPRTIDLDLLLYGGLVREDADLTLPHPRLHERRFVLAPLAEIAPQLIHPVLGCSVNDLLARLGQSGVQSECELAGLRAVVTGSTNGIGRAIALELARAGADVLVHGRRAAAAAEMAAQVQSQRVRSQVLLADLANTDECATLAAAAWAAWDGIDIWINNAGADTLTGEAAAWPFERKLAALWAIDVAATMQLARDVGGRMKARGTGIILNMGWDQADTGMEGDSGQLFSATKAAVMAFSKSLARSLAPQVRVNCLAPGWIRTAWGEKASKAWQERVRQETLLQRWGLPEDVAATARWLVSPQAAFITGQVIRINGGAVR